MHFGLREEGTHALCSFRGGITELPMKTSRPPPLQAISVLEDSYKTQALDDIEKEINHPPPPPQEKK